MASHDGIEDLLSELIKALPSEVIKFAWPGPIPSRLPDEFFGVFGEGLLKIATLTFAALYVTKLRQGEIEKNHDLNETLRSLIFLSGYNPNVAKVVLLKASIIDGEVFSSVGNALPMTTFFPRPQRPSDSLLHGKTYRSEFKSLVKNLEVLRLLKIDGSKPEPFSLQGRQLDAFPFLHFHQERLLAFDSLQPSPSAGYGIRFDTGEGRREVDRRDYSRIKSVLDLLAESLDTPTSLYSTDGAQNKKGSGFTFSMLAAVAEDNADLVFLVILICEHSSIETKKALGWIDMRTKPEGITEEEFAKQQGTQVQNTILKQCIAEDPISTLQKYLELEPQDVENYFRLIAKNNTELLDDVELRIKAKEDHLFEEIEPFFPGQDSQRSFRTYRRQNSARLRAVEIVRLLNIEVEEWPHEEDIIDYQFRVRQLERYVEKFADDLEGAQRGFRACQKVTRRILVFLIKFYRLLPLYTPTKPSGISGALSLEHQKFRAAPLHTLDDVELIQAFLDLNGDEGIKEMAIETLQRVEGIWPMNSENDIADALKGILYNRGETHDGVLQGIRAFHFFVDWLREPIQHREVDSHQIDSYRIYPAVVAIHLHIETRSRIRSLQYFLKDLTAYAEGEDSMGKSVTLFTSQQVDPRKCYYGLPRRDNVSQDLWQEPLLIDTDEVHPHGLS